MTGNVFSDTERPSQCLLPVPGPASSNTDRPRISYLCPIWFPQTLTDPAPHTCARPDLLRCRQTPRLIPVPWTLTDQNLIPVPGRASRDINRPNAAYLCKAFSNTDRLCLIPVPGPTSSDTGRPRASHLCLASVCTDRPSTSSLCLAHLLGH